MSHEQAVADGLSFTPDVELFSGTVTPRPAVSSETASMLNTSVFRQKTAFGLAWKIPNGTYDVYFWVMENVRDNHRRFDASIEGVPVLRDIGRGAALGDWGKLGPFRVSVQDGVLNVDLIPRKTDAHLMGLAVFEAP
jgi:hyaluronate lyase